MSRVEVVVFDLDGTLLDSDRALAEAFVVLGVPRSEITFGHVIAEECARLGLTLDDYLDAYDTSAAMPFPGIEAMLDHVERWVVCSNKHPRSGHAELDRLGWSPEETFFADAFSGPKSVGAVLEAMALDPSSVMFVGDTDHDRTTAREAGCRFVLAGWNPRAAAHPGDEVASVPAMVLDACGGQLLV